MTVSGMTGKEISNLIPGNEKSAALLVLTTLKYIEDDQNASNVSTPSARLTAYDASGAEGIIDTTDFTRDDFYTLDAIERKHGKLPA